MAVDAGPHGVRRLAGGVRRWTWQTLQVIDPVRLTLSAPSPELKIGLVSVYRTRNAHRIRALLGALPHSAVVRLCCLDGEAPPELAGFTISHGPGDRFTLLNRLIADIPSERRRDALVLVDDDVRFVVGDIGRLVAAGRSASFDLYQPAHSAKSHANWGFVRRRALTRWRRTNFVEQGPLVGLSLRAQASLLPLPEHLGMAWGIEARWWQAAFRDGLVEGIVDAIAIEHLLPTAHAYDRAPQQQMLDNELQRVGLTGMSTLQQTLVRRKFHTRGPRHVPPSPEPAPRAASSRRHPHAAVSVVVPTHQRRDQVVRLVRSLLDDPAVLEIIVVVDGGDDDSFAALTALAECVPILCPVTQSQSGAGGARQHGLERARGEIVLFLDDDVMPSPGLATSHLAAHRENASRVVVGSLPLVPASRRTVHSVVDDLYAEDYQRCCRDYDRDSTTILTHLWAGNFSMLRSQALAVGIGDSSFNALFFEDRDLGLRLRAAGVEAVFRRDLSSAHYHYGTLPGYLRASVSQGKAMSLLRERYPNEVPPMTATALTGRFPRPARLVVAAAMLSPKWAGRAICSFFLALAYVFGMLHMTACQRVLVVLLRRVGQARGVGLARRSPGQGEPRHA